MDIPEIFKIKKITEENRKVKTFFIDGYIKFKPGQFLMVWLPGVDEKPLSPSYTGSKFAFTIEKKGKWSSAMFKLKIGDKIGIRGPYGTFFKYKKNCWVIAGGIGIVPLAPLIEQFRIKDAIYGVKSRADLIFKNRFKDIILCSDNGTIGYHGYTTDLLKEKLKTDKIKSIITVGPEIMMKKVLDICNQHKIEMQASLERYMKCGFGLCGSCVCDDQLVCKDGPVFNKAQLNKMGEFGKFARLKSGKKVFLKNYFEWRQ